MYFPAQPSTQSEGGMDIFCSALIRRRLRSGFLAMSGRRNCVSNSVFTKIRGAPPPWRMNGCKVGPCPATALGCNWRCERDEDRGQAFQACLTSARLAAQIASSTPAVSSAKCVKASTTALTMFSMCRSIGQSKLPAIGMTALYMIGAGRSSAGVLSTH